MKNNFFAKPTLDNVLQAVKDNVHENLNCINIGQIVEFNSTNQTAQVQVMIKRISEIKLDGTIVYQQFPTILNDVPCFVLFGGTGYLTMPITKGDNCILLFADREIDNWFQNGSYTATTTLRTHDVSDAIAIVGINSLQTSIQSYLTTGIKMAFGSTNIQLTAAEIASVATIFLHTGNMHVTGNCIVDGTLSAGNGATGTFDTVTVHNGIVVSGV